MPEEPDLSEVALRRARGTRASGRPSSTRSSTQRQSPAQSAAGQLDDRDPQPVAAVVDRLVAERGWSDDISSGALVGQWPDIVGAEVAEHVLPESFDPVTRVLVLRASSTAWATQVRLLRGPLVERIEAAIGPVADVVVRGPAAPTWVAGPRRVPGRGPRDTYG